MTDQTHVIVGASLAGASAAAALRKQGFDGRIVLIGEEPERPYERPELSKKYLRGEPGTDVFVHPADFYANQDIQLVTGARVEHVDPRRHEVATARATYHYDRLLLATGTAPRALEVPGAELDGVVSLRTMRDADGIRERAQAAQSIVVVGGGWIGSEVAASLRQLGRDVALVAPGAAPLQRVLGPEVAEVYRAAHAENGVRLVLGTTVAAFRGSGRVDAVVTADGGVLRAGLVVVGIGAAPRTELAAAAGLELERGIVVDEHLETSVPGIFAAGDVADAWHPLFGHRLRVEHWDNAKRQGRAAAASMIGNGKAYDRIPYFYSDQYDLGMEYTGYAPRWDEVVVRGDIDSREFIAFWLAEGRVVAGMNVNVWDVAPAIERIVRSQVAIDRARLADKGEPLEELAPAA
ncbi:MAG TPA: FAD-dependent oxidoreductase [Candidatus Limnocylindrales bacterium]|nr:FAD-dependent oxidoreductase [Candidatus Limnocylindrales bacterium]